MKHMVPLLAAALLVLSGCAEERSSRAQTVDPPSESSAATEPAPAESSAAEPDDAAGEQLTQEQADAALLTVQDLPTGWTTDPAAEEDDGPDDITEPAECAQIFQALEDQQDPVAQAEADFTAGGFGPFLSQSVSSFDDSTTDALAAVTEALNACPTFTSIDADGVRAEFTAAPLSFPNVGDSTVAVRLSASTEDFDLAFDVVAVSLGNNGMTIVAGGLTPMDGVQLEQVVRAGVSRIATAAQS